MNIDLNALRLERTTIRRYDLEATNDYGLWHMPGLTDPEDEWWDAIVSDHVNPDDTRGPRIPATYGDAKRHFTGILEAHDYNVVAWVLSGDDVWRPTLTRDIYEVVYWTTLHDCRTVNYSSRRAFEVDEAKIGRYGKVISGPILGPRGGVAEGLTFRLPGIAVAYVEVKVETKPVN